MLNPNSNHKEIIRSSLNSNDYLNKGEKIKLNKKLKKEALITNDDIELSTLIKNSESDKEIKKIIQSIENFEYEKPYTYSFLYDLVELKENEIIEKILKNKINTDETTKHIFNQDTVDFLSFNFEKPTLNHTKDSKIIEIKFSNILKNKSEPKQIKYPIIVIIYIEENIMQFKFDGTTEEYRKENMILRNANRIEKWLKDQLLLNFSNHRTFRNVSTLAKDMNEYPLEFKDVNEYLSYGHDEFEGHVKLRINDHDQMPILKDLKVLCEDFKCEEDKTILSEFLKKIEETTKYYRRGIEWTWDFGETKKSRLILIFHDRYEQSNKTLIHIYNNSQSKERREHVIKYVGNYSKKKVKK